MRQNPCTKLHLVDMREAYVRSASMRPAKRGEQYVQQSAAAERRLISGPVIGPPKVGMSGIGPKMGRSGRALASRQLRCGTLLSARKWRQVSRWPPLEEYIGGRRHASLFRSDSGTMMQRRRERPAGETESFPGPFARFDAWNSGTISAFPRKIITCNRSEVQICVGISIRPLTKFQRKKFTPWRWTLAVENY